MVDGAVSPNVSVVAVNDASDGGESDSRTFEVFVAVQAVEGVKELANVKHIETCAVIADKPGFLLSIPTEVDDGFGHPGAELDGVAQKILQGYAEEPRIAGSQQIGLDVDGDVAAGFLFEEAGGDGLGKLTDVEGIAHDLGSGDAGKLKECVNERSHALDPITNTADIVPPGVVDDPGIVFFERETESVDRAQGSAEVVRDRIAEGLEFAIDGL